MPAPETYQYSTAALVAAHTALRDVLDAENVAESGAAHINLRSAADVLLATVPLTDPSGTINTETGQLTLTPDGREEDSPATGVVAYGEICDAAGAVHIALPAEAGTAPVPGKLVVNTTSVIAGGPVEIFSAVVG